MTSETTSMVSSWVMVSALRGLSLVACDRHALQQDRAARASAAHQHVGSDLADSLEHVAQVAGDGDLLHREADLATFDPVAGGAARVIPGHGVHALPEQLGDEQAAAYGG